MRSDDTFLNLLNVLERFIALVLWESRIYGFDVIMAFEEAYPDVEEIFY